MSLSRFCLSSGWGGTHNFLKESFQLFEFLKFIYEGQRICGLLVFVLVFSRLGTAFVPKLCHTQAHLGWGFFVNTVKGCKQHWYRAQRNLTEVLL